LHFADGKTETVSIFKVVYKANRFI
jgi:hypothetical protein